MDQFEILFFFSKKKVKSSSVSCLSTQEIPLVDSINRLIISSQDENTEIFSATKISPVVERSNLLNFNHVQENNLENEKPE